MWLRTRGSWVQFLPGAPFLSLLNIRFNNRQTRGCQSGLSLQSGESRHWSMKFIWCLLGVVGKSNTSLAADFSSSSELGPLTNHRRLIGKDRMTAISSSSFPKKNSRSIPLSLENAAFFMKSPPSIHSCCVNCTSWSWSERTVVGSSPSARMIKTNLINSPEDMIFYYDLNIHSSVYAGNVRCKITMR